MNTNDDISVVIRYMDIEGKWYICHANSYQNAFSRKVNGFESRDAAVEFAESNGCVVVYHENDQLAVKG